MMQQVLLIIGVLIIVCLAGVAIYLNWQVYKKRKLTQKQIQEQIDQQKEARASYVESIRFIARAYAAGQVDSPEACIRVSGLLDLLEVEGSRREQYVAIDKMRDSISHIPVKNEWLALSKQQRRSYRQQLDEKTLALKDFVDPAMRALQDFSTSDDSPSA